MKMRITLVISLVLFYHLVLKAQSVTYNQEFQVNTYTYLFQENPSVCGLSDGGFVICWQSYSQDGDNDGVYAQLYDSDGSKRGDEFQVNTYIKDGQCDPNVCILSNGGFIICWESWWQDSFGWGIYAQLYNSDGTKRGDEFQVNTYTYLYQENPSVCALSDGGFVICWESWVEDTNGNEIYAQLYNNDGSRRGTEFQVNTYIEGGQVYPNVSGRSDGGFVICWECIKRSGIYAQLYNSDGLRRGTEFQVNTYTRDYQITPSVCGLSDGGFVICWEIWELDADVQEIYAQLYNSDGSKRGAEFRVNTYTRDYQGSPSVSSISNYGFVICWVSSDQGVDDLDICTQLYNNDGSRRGFEFKVNTYARNRQDSPSVCNLSDDTFVICWISYEQDGSGSGIYGKYLKEINHQLSPFSLLEPDNDIILETTNSLLKWNKACLEPIILPWELEYHLYLDENEDFNNPRIIKAIYDTTFTVDSLIPGTTYFWKVLAKNIAGDSLWSIKANGFFVSYNAKEEPENPIELNNEIPGSFRLYQNHPNPFNYMTTIEYSIKKESYVRLVIYNHLGEVVKTLVNTKQSPGYKKVIWSGDDESGRPVSSGLYFVRMVTEDYVKTRKMILLK